MIRKLTVFLLSGLLIFGGVATAQDVETPTPDAIVTNTPIPTLEPTPEPTPIPDDPAPDPVDEEPVTSPDELLQKLINLLSDASYMAWAAAATVVFTGLIKVIAAALNINITGAGSVLLALTIQVLIWLGYSVANYLGQGEGFKTWYLALADIARAVLPLFGAIGLGHEGYKLAHRRGWPVLGFRAADPPNRKYPANTELYTKKTSEGQDWTVPPRSE